MPVAERYLEFEVPLEPADRGVMDLTDAMDYGWVMLDYKARPQSIIGEIVSLYQTDNVLHGIIRKLHTLKGVWDMYDVNADKFSWGYCLRVGAVNRLQYISLLTRSIYAKAE